MIISCFLLIPGRVPGIVSLVYWHSVPSSFASSSGAELGSQFFQETFFHQGFLVPSGFGPGLVSLPFFSFLVFSFLFSGKASLPTFLFLAQERDCVPGSGACLPFSFFAFFQERGGQ